MLSFRDKIIHVLKTESVLVAALLAAVISAFFNPPSSEYLEFIDTKVLLCLFCLMVVVAGFKKLGAFEDAASLVARKSRSLRSLTMGILLLTYFLAMVMTNDVALITLVPFTLILLDKIGERDYAILIIVLQTIGANIGSSLTPVGNPQNLYLFTYFQIPIGDFFLILLPVVLVGGLLLALSTLLIEKKPIVVPELMDSDQPDAMKPEVPKALLSRKAMLVIYSVLFAVAVLAIFKLLPIEWVTVLIVLCVIIMDRRLLREVDYSLLVTFIGFFIFVGNLSAIPAVNAFLSSLLSKSVYLVSLLTSQIISNVPAAVLLSGFTLDYKALLLGVNVGGMGTLIASLASVISYKFYTKAHPRASRRYLKIFTGLNLVFLAVLTLTVLIMSLIAP
jgi:Na+/H+ antiporter NhaD/arsenite permease-like protein